MKTRALLLSGGVDSTALLISERFGEDTDICVYVDYGQPAAAQEEKASRRMAGRFAVDWTKITIAPVKRGRMDDAPGQAGPRVVQARNLLLIAAAANTLDGPGVVLYGAHASDAAAYPDCRGEFVTATSLALHAGYGLSCVAPLLTKSRADIQAILKSSGIVDMTHLWSCYAPLPNGQPCMECDSCRQPA